MNVETIQLPIVRVTVLEDRAVVERRGDVNLPAGAHKLLVSGLPAIAVDRSVQATVTGGTVNDAKLERRWHKEESLPAENAELEKTVKELEKQVLAKAHEVQRAEAKSQLAAKAREEVLRSIRETAGAGTGTADGWKTQLDAVNAAIAEADLRKRMLKRDLLLLERRNAEAVAARNQTKKKQDRLLTHAELNVQHAGGAATVTLRYLVPCAAWRPSYRALLKQGEGGESVTLECEGVVWQRTGEEWSNVELVLSTARPTLGATPPKLVEDWLYLRDKTAVEKQVVDVVVREETIQTTGEGAAVTMSSVPGVDDGGEAQSLKAPHRANVPSDGEPHRVPLFQLTSPANSELVATPEQSPLVHRIARFDNTASRPLLAGPVELVRNSGYVGRGQLKFAAPGERLKLSFGSEDALRVARMEQQAEDTSLFGKKTVTRTIKLFVSNAGDKPVTLAIDERIYVSEVEAVEVKVIKDKSKPPPSSVDKDGIARFEVSAPASSQQELQFVWSTVGSSKVVGL